MSIVLLQRSSAFENPTELIDGLKNTVRNCPSVTLWNEHIINSLQQKPLLSISYPFLFPCFLFLFLSLFLYSCGLFFFFFFFFQAEALPHTKS